MKFSIYTIGCKLNFSESSTIYRKFIKKGYHYVNFKEIADIYIINTCSVTENAIKDFKSILNKILKINYKAFIIAIGCYVQLNPKKFLSYKRINLVLGSIEKLNIINYLKKSPKKRIFFSKKGLNFYFPSYSLENRTRSFLKIQDGCDYKCSYCTIPFARGKSRSENLINILNNIKNISKKGIKEIVLTGINIGDYGKINFQYKYTFFDLIQAIEELGCIKRVRISSIEPNLLKYKIIDFISKSKCFLPHFHIPLQSGSDFILKKMRRRYLSNFFKEKIEKIRYMIPNASIGVDIIVGFPGESEDHFLETFYFLKSLDISYFHIFSFSERPGTNAFKMKNKIEKKKKKKKKKIFKFFYKKKKKIF
jgi:threonylcarbamoyladenosine tRNA methylthiotransferase MtaB